MRQRLRPMRARLMARRPGEDGRFSLSARDRRIVGWVAAITVIAGIALAVRLLGGNGDGTAVDPPPSASTDTGGPLAITFGTSLADDGAVSSNATTGRFAAGDTFAYSVAGPDPLPEVVYVEVRRTGGGPAETVQPAAEQPVPQERAPAIAFTVPTDALLEVFGPGEYLMLLYLDAREAPYAQGSFRLVAPPTASGSP